jgi:hypothetical protein
MELQVSFPLSQERVTILYPELNESNPYGHLIFKINFIIVFVSLHDYQIVFSLQVIRIRVAQAV